MQTGKAQGGKNVYGAAIGIIMLESQFPRIYGDAGNAATWPFPVLFRVVTDASPDQVVRQNAKGLLEPFLDAARDLVKNGVDGITTNCGFLTLFQAELSAAVAVPVASSSLLQVPWVQTILPPGKRVGVVTISATTLTSKHLECAGVSLDTPIIGTETGQEFSRAILGNEMALDIDQSRADIITAGRKLCAQDPNIGALVLECTNMVPYASDVSDALGIPVFDFYSFITWFQAGLRPRRF